MREILKSILSGMSLGLWIKAGENTVENLTVVDKQVNKVLSEYDRKEIGA